MCVCARARMCVCVCVSLPAVIIACREHSRGTSQTIIMIKHNNDQNK